MMASKFSGLVAGAALSYTLKRLALGISVLALQACTVFPDSPAAKLYALDLPAASSIGTCTIRFAVREVRLPGYLDRPELVLSRDGSRTEVSSQHLWAAPLAAETTRLMGLGLQERLQGSQLMPYPVRIAERPEWIIAPVMTRYELSNARLSMEFSVTAIRPDGSGSTQAKALGPFRSVHSVGMSRGTESGSAGATAAAVAQAYAQNILAHVGDIAVGVKSGICP